MNAAVEACQGWSGPARELLAARVRDEAHQAHVRAARLENSANALTTAAGRVEQTQRQWESRVNHLRNNAINQLRAIAQRTRI